MQTIRAIILLCVAAWAAVGSAYAARGIGERAAVKQWEVRQRNADAATDSTAAEVDRGEYVRLARAAATRHAMTVWCAATLLGLGVGYIMGRGGLYIGQPSVEHGVMGLGFLLVKLVVILLVLGVARVIARWVSRAVGIGYAAAVAGLIVGVLVTIPITFVLTAFAGQGTLADVQVSIAMRVALACGTLTCAVTAATLAPMITPADGANAS